MYNVKLIGMSREWWKLWQTGEVENPSFKRCRPLVSGRSFTPWKDEPRVANTSDFFFSRGHRSVSSYKFGVFVGGIEFRILSHRHFGSLLTFPILAIPVSM